MCNKSPEIVSEAIDYFNNKYKAMQEKTPLKNRTNQ